mmetsp:Transcript_11985/g.21777  ORF Transcript_11985/g.21777 Transcript_11985/m.21777 type:complete len:204 (-) Transcript_11985:52-663(-)
MQTLQQLLRSFPSLEHPVLRLLFGGVDGGQGGLRLLIRVIHIPGLWYVIRSLVLNVLDGLGLSQQMVNLKPKSRVNGPNLGATGDPALPLVDAAIQFVGLVLAEADFGEGAIHSGRHDVAPLQCVGIPLVLLSLPRTPRLLPLAHVRAGDVEVAITPFAEDVVAVMGLLVAIPIIICTPSAKELVRVTLDEGCITAFVRKHRP